VAPPRRVAVAYQATLTQEAKRFRLKVQMAKTLWKTAAGLTLAFGLLVASSPPLAGAVVIGEGDITEVENTANHYFAQQITFSLRVVCEARVNRVLVFFQANGDDGTESEDVAFEQSDNLVAATHMHDLRLAPLPPFATVSFWWWVEYGDGKVWSSSIQQFEYTDNRFRWEQLSDGDSGITVHWIEGQADATFGQAALDTARASLEDINVELRAPLPELIDIYVYDTQPNLDAAMVLAGRDWVGGQAHPELGIVAVAIPADDFAASRMDRYIPHEITHLLVYQAATPQGYDYIPEWLDEGLATANERLPTVEFDLELERARTETGFIPLEDLCVPFSPNAQTALLSYAQSGSVVRFIRQRYGAQGIRNLITAYTNGASCTSGVEEALGITLHELDTAWRASLDPESDTLSPWQAWFSKNGMWVLLWVVSALVAAPWIGRLRPRR
jgi:hypothetical protein